MRVIAILILWTIMWVSGFAIYQSVANAKDWSNADPTLRVWFESLRQPDNPQVSCCGNGDAYYADEYRVEGTKVLATITDNRGNPVPVGTVVEIPPYKVNRDPNITGHTIVFLSPAQHVYCFIVGSGV